MGESIGKNNESSGEGSPKTTVVLALISAGAGALMGLANLPPLAIGAIAGSIIPLAFTAVCLTVVLK